MTGFAITIVEMYRTSVGTYFQSEEAIAKVGRTFQSARLLRSPLDRIATGNRGIEK